MNKLISCEFNIDTASVELKFTDGSMISIYCPADEDEVAHNCISGLSWTGWRITIRWATLI